MRAKEFINEAKQGKMPSDQQRATRGLHLYADGEKMNSDYTMYRLSLALACSDGVKPIEMDAKSWIGKKKSAHPYSDIEHEMLRHAYAVVGANHEDLNHGDMDSLEAEDTNKVSPVAAKKKNRYGV